MKVKHLTIILLAITLVGGYLILHEKLWRLHPHDEWRSRCLCREALADLRSAIIAYLMESNNVLPTDFQELIDGEYVYKYRLVCPSQIVTVKRAGLLDRDCPVFVTSYRLLVPGQDFSKLEDGTVVVKEIEGNHPDAVVDGTEHPAGYHILIKEGEWLCLEFVESEGMGDDGTGPAEPEPASGIHSTTQPDRDTGSQENRH